jgi:hypothetical protein
MQIYVINYAQILLLHILKQSEKLADCQNIFIIN